MFKKSIVFTLISFVFVVPAFQSLVGQEKSVNKTTPETNFREWRRNSKPTPRLGVKDSDEFVEDLVESGFASKFRNRILSCKTSFSTALDLGDDGAEAFNLSPNMLRSYVHAAMKNLCFDKKLKELLDRRISWNNELEKLEFTSSKRKKKTVGDNFGDLKKYFLDTSYEIPAKYKIFEDFCNTFSSKKLLEAFLLQFKKDVPLQQLDNSAEVLLFVLRYVKNNENPDSFTVEILNNILQRFFRIDMSINLRRYLAVFLQVLVCEITQVDPRSGNIIEVNEARVAPKTNYFSLVETVLGWLALETNTIHSLGSDRSKIKGDTVSLFRRALDASYRGIIACRESDVCLLQEREKYGLFSFLRISIVPNLESNGFLKELLGDFLEKLKKIFVLDWEHLFSFQLSRGAGLEGGHHLSSWNDKDESSFIVVIKPYLIEKMKKSNSEYVDKTCLKRLIFEELTIQAVRKIMMEVEEEEGSRIVNRRTGVYSSNYTAKIEKTLMDGNSSEKNDGKMSTQFCNDISIKRLLQLLSQARAKINLSKESRVIEGDDSKLFVSSFDYEDKQIQLVMCFDKGQNDVFYMLTTAYPVLCWIDVCGKKANEINSSIISQKLKEQFEGKSFDRMKEKIEFALNGKVVDTQLNGYPVKILGGGLVGIIADDAVCLEAAVQALR